MRIGVVAPSTPITRDVAERVTALAAAQFPSAEIVFHAQCFEVHNHFAGTDAVRAKAFLEVANDPAFDALWFARGGYGSCRIAEEVLGRLAPAAREKQYLGYSDAGYVLAGLYAAGFERVAHGPMPKDILRDGGDAAVLRALAWLVEADSSSLEPNLSGTDKTVAFNITVFSQLLGTPLQPDVTDHVLMIEDVSEHMYRTDRSMFHITSNPGVRRAAGIRLGRCTDVPENDVDFGETEEEVVRHWCERAGITYVGRADIGHDAANKVVPFGLTHKFLR
ncbi:MAG TPA: LD-carboxypeptidase [Allosphingosinicella sp.]|uniref:LD-carboxypeptidase n=1 Tax=Allosphingosinicella sp. TaxID=2823234 RepID=UPI002ED94A94